MTATAGVPDWWFAIGAVVMLVAVSAALVCRERAPRASGQDSLTARDRDSEEAAP